MRNYSKGFAVIETMLFFLIAAILIGTVYYVYRSNKNTSDSLKNVGSNELNVKKPKNSETSAASAQNYISIKEWGVRAPYSGSLTLNYKVDSGEQAARFASKELTAADPECNLEIGGGEIARFAPSDKIILPGDSTGPTAEEYAKTNKDYYHVGGYYYTYIHDQAACSDNAKAAGLQSQTSDAVKDLVPKLELIQ